LIVGEVRGSEAYVLFQALATGHGGMCTMHAESLDSAVKRLTQKPMDIAPAYIPLMNVVAIAQRVHLKKDGETKAFRRMTSIDEIADYENYHKVFEWDPTQDIFSSSLGKSALLSKLSKHLGVSQFDLMEEMARRKNVLAWMRSRKIRSYNDVAAIIAEYYSRPDEFYKRRVEPTVLVQHS
jgi:flagellar protein FlaI